jgi:hypothetical protein
VAAALLVLALALVLAVSGCGTGSSAAADTQPKALVVLSNTLTADEPAAMAASGTVKSLRTVSVTLAVGQSLAVRYQHAPVTVAWSQASGGSTQILQAEPVSTASACPSGPVPAGCGPQLQQSYVARATGTTTVVWEYGPCRELSGNTVVSCPDVTKTIEVTVR